MGATYAVLGLAAGSNSGQKFFMNGIPDFGWHGQRNSGFSKIIKENIEVFFYFDIAMLFSIVKLIPQLVIAFVLNRPFFRLVGKYLDYLRPLHFGCFAAGRAWSIRFFVSCGDKSQ